MTHDEIDDALRRIFPGDPVPDVSEPTCWSDEGPSWRLSAPPTKLKKQVESPRVNARVSTPVLPEFQRLMDGLPPAPSAPTRQYLIEDKAHVARWLNEAHDIESDVKLGIAVEPHQVTRLLLEAIPVVQKCGT